MALQPIQFVVDSYQDRSLPVEAKDLINLYPEGKPADAKAQVVLHGTPGQKFFAEAGNGPIRGMLVFDELLYVVSGGRFYEVTELGAVTLRGSISGVRAVDMARNSTQITITADTDVYVYDTVAATLVLSSFVDATGVAILDGIGVYTLRNTDQFYITDVNDFLTITDFAQANALPDNVVCPRVSNRELWIFGEKTIQVYYNSGQADFPFSRIPSGIIQRGALSARSIAEYQGVMMWLGDDKRIYLSDGYVPREISTPAIERQINTYEDPTEATALTYQEEGHIFYSITFNEQTWVYDLTARLWHKRQAYQKTVWEPRFCAYQWGKNIVGGTETGRLYELNLNVYTDHGDILPRIATSPPVHANGIPAQMGRFYLDMETGVGLPVGQGSNPQAMLEWSDDGGYTYSSQLWRSFGVLGARQVRAEWWRLGQFYQRTLRVTISDPVKVAIIRAYADVEVGRE